MLASQYLCKTHGLARKIICGQKLSNNRQKYSPFLRHISVLKGIDNRMSGSEMSNRSLSSKANRLATEQSPYLLQHAHNPVEWYPWGEEAFQKARAEDKVIFLSVGYATCHWCHVMERESFENEEVAKLMNQHFVNIKVDKEERPDIDRVYMTYVQAVSGGGGWPMSVWLTPSLEPLYGGTYYPPYDMNQGGNRVMPGFTTVLSRIAQLWQNDRTRLSSQGATIMAQLQGAMASERQEGQLPNDLPAVALSTVQTQLWRRFDKELGGFGGAPKFPRCSEINVLLCAAQYFEAIEKTEEADQARHMVLFSLQKMADGGIYDHIGGGFHRYSVDEYWHVPHFEKMLYDNAQLAWTYLAAYHFSGDPIYGAVAEGILEYLRRDMTDAEGGVYSAEDADSLDPASGHKKEGAFYIWSQKEINQTLTTEQACIFNTYYNVKPEGNCTLSMRSDPHGEFKGLNVLIALKSKEEVAAQLQLKGGVEELTRVLRECQERLFSVRATRPRPSLDNKVVTAWNGMSISALALASRSLPPPSRPTVRAEDEQPESSTSGRTVTDREGQQVAQQSLSYIERAVRIADFIKRQLYDEETGRLRRSYCNAPSAVEGFADDYAYLIAGLLDLYECGGGLKWLQWAVKLQEKMDELFWDPTGGAYFSTTGLDPSVKIRIKDDYDGAEPTASSVAAANLFRLDALLPASSGGRYLERAKNTLLAFSERLMEVPIALPQMTCAVYLHLKSPLRQVIIAGSKGDQDTEQLLNAVHSAFVPDRAVLILDPQSQDDLDFWRQHSPEAVEMVMKHLGQTAGEAIKEKGTGPKAEPGPVPATAFICQNFTCQAPTSDPAKVRQLLLSSGSRPRLEPAGMF